jgi:hypothetical protein
MAATPVGPAESQRSACAVCGGLIDGESPAIGETWTATDFEWTYHPFLEDLRIRVDRLYHPICHADTYGVGRLMEVIHARDVAERRELAEMAERLEFLKQQLVDTDHRTPGQHDRPAEHHPGD